METSLTAPFHGRVREVLVGANVHVAAQAPLRAIEPLDGGPPPAAGERVAFAPTAADAAPTLPRAAQRLEWLVLGYDVDARRGRADRRRRAARPPTRPPCAGEHRLLRDLRRRARAVAARATTRPTRRPAAAQPAGAPHAWLRSLDAAAEGCPTVPGAPASARSPTTAIDGLDRTPALEEACYRLFLAQERAGDRARRRRGDPRPPARAGRRAGRAARRRTSARRSTTSSRPR